MTASDKVQFLGGMPIFVYDKVLPTQAANSQLTRMAVCLATKAAALDRILAADGVRTSHADAHQEVAFALPESREGCECALGGTRLSAED